MHWDSILAAVLSLAVVIGLLIFFLKPHWTLKIIVWLLRHTVVNLRVIGGANIPESGPVLIVSNHVSLIDLLLIQSISPRPVRFMIQQEVLEFVPTRFIFWYLGVIKVPNLRRPKAMQRFFERSRAELRKGGVLCLFPEGGISGNGGLMRFKSGVAPLLPAGVQVSVIPVRIGMLWGRLFTIFRGKLKYQKPRTLPVQFNLNIGDPVSPELSAFQLRQRISELGAEAEMGPQPNEVPIHTAFALRAKRHPFAVTYYDADGARVTNFEMLVRAAILSKKIRALDIGESGYVGVLMPNCTVLALSLIHI